MKRGNIIWISSDATPCGEAFRLANGDWAGAYSLPGPPKNATWFPFDNTPTLVVDFCDLDGHRLENPLERYNFFAIVLYGEKTYFAHRSFIKD